MTTDHSSPKRRMIRRPPSKHGNMDEIFPCLWLGSSEASTDAPLLKSHRITYILTISPSYTTPQKDIISTFPTATPFHDGTFWRLVIPVYDLPTENLLTHFRTTFTFIHAALQIGGSVLVHCAAGASRSATIVVAYLMRAYKWGALQTLKRIREKRPMVRPNVGFLDQLLIYEACGYKPVDQIEYVHWKLRFESGTVIERPPEESAFVDVFRPGELGAKIPLEIPFMDTRPPAHRGEKGLVCRSCETFLAPMKAVLPFADVEQFYLGQAMDWMEPEFNNREQVGQFCCPGCEMLVGKYNWNGRRDGGGLWVTPAFELCSNLVQANAGGSQRHDVGSRME
jgi:dual specificity phosphatase 12